MRHTPERIELLRSALGKPEGEVRQIIRLHDGNVYRDELDAILLKLYSTSEDFNDGVRDCLHGRPRRSGFCSYISGINYGTGYESAELAVELHGKETVLASL